MKKHSSTKLIEALKKNYTYEKQKMRSAWRIVLGDGDFIFRSEYEFNIAVLLDHHNIEYSYEEDKDMILWKKKEKWNKHYERFGLTKDDMNDRHHLYHPDFRIEDSNIYIEAKGYFSQEDRTKMILVQKTNPDKVILMCLQSPNAKATTKLLAWEWCEKYGIEWTTIENLTTDINELKKNKEL